MAAVPRRLDAIAVLPVFFRLAGKRAVVAGGTPPAAWKAELLAAAGADVWVFADDPCPELSDLDAAAGGAVHVVRRTWRDGDLASAAIAVGALDGRDGEAFRDAAHRAGVPANIVDAPALCDFQFGTIVGRSPLVIGISTDGAAPVFGQALRTRLEALLPRGIGAWARAAADWRPDIRSRALGFTARRRFWEAFAESALRSEGRPPDEDDRTACLAAALAGAAAVGGRLTLVGAGPGDPDLVTLGAVRALQSADAVLYEAEVPESVLALGRREARRIAAPRGEDDAAERARDLWAEGLSVVWIGAGSPEACPAWSTRLARLATCGVAFSCVAAVRCAACPEGCAARRSLGAATPAIGGAAALSDPG